jgi:hypothetical protein
MYCRFADSEKDDVKTCQTLLQEKKPYCKQQEEEERRKK